MTKSRRIVISSILLLISILLFSETQKKQIVAKYNSSELTSSDVTLYKNIEQIRQHLGRRNWRKELIENIIFEDLLARKAIKEGYDKSQSFKTLFEERKRRLLMNLLMQDIDRSISISENEIKEYYDKHIDEYKNPKVRRISYIFFDFGTEIPTAEDEQRALERAKTILERAKNGEDFNELAIKYSDAPSGRRGGNLGFIPKGKYKSFDKEAWSLKIGEFSEPIKTKYGYCIIKVEEEKDSWITPLSNVKMSIRNKLRDEKRQASLDNIKEEYIRQNKIGKNFDILDKHNIKDDDVIFWIADFKFTYRDFLNYLDEYIIDRQLRKEQKNEILSQIFEDNLNVNIAQDKLLDNNEENKKQIQFIRNNLLSNLYIEEKLKEKEPTNEELQNYFTENYDSFKKYINRRVSLIFIGIGSIEDPESKAAIHYAFKRIEPKVKMIEEKLKNNEDFEKLAMEYSDDSSAKFGGDIGWIQEPYKRDLDGYIRKLKQNEVSQPIKTDDGYYFLKLIDIKPPELSDIRNEVRARLVDEIRIKIRDEIKDKLFQEHKVEIFSQGNDETQS